MAQEIPSTEINRVTLPAADWHIALANAVRGSVDSTVIVVDTAAKKEMALIAAERMNKQVTVEVEER